MRAPARAHGVRAQSACQCAREGNGVGVLGSAPVLLAMGACLPAISLLLPNAHAHAHTHTRALSLTHTHTHTHTHSLSHTHTHTGDGAGRSACTAGFGVMKDDFWCGRREHERFATCRAALWALQRSLAIGGVDGGSMPPWANPDVCVWLTGYFDM